MRISLVAGCLGAAIALFAASPRAWAQDFLSFPFYVHASQPILNAFGEPLPGDAQSAPETRALVLVLGAENGIFPPNLDGSPHPDNPILDGGVTGIGHLTSPMTSNSGRFALRLTDERPAPGTKFFVRAYNAPSWEEALFYGDSEVMTVVANQRMRYDVRVTATDQLIDPDQVPDNHLVVTANALSKTYGDADPDLTWQITSGGPAPGDAITGELERVPGEDVGVYPILQGTLAADANYSLSFFPAELTVEPRTLSLTGLTAEDKEYDGAASATLSGFGALDDVLDGDDVTLNTETAEAAFDDTHPGENKTVTVTGLTLEGADAGNYRIEDTQTTTASITARALTLTGLTAANKIYDGDASTAIIDTGTLEGVLEGDDVAVSVTGASATFESANAGQNKTVTVTGLTLTGEDAGRYRVDGEPTATATIFPWLHDLADYRQVGENWSPDWVNALEDRPIATHGNYVVTLGGALHYEGATDFEGIVSIDPWILNAEMTGTDAYVNDGWLLNQAAAAEALGVSLVLESTGDLEMRTQELLYQGTPVLMELLYQPDGSRARLKQVTATGIDLAGRIMVVDPTLTPDTGPVRLQDALDSLNPQARVDRLLHASEETASRLQGHAISSVEMILMDPEDRITGFDKANPEDADGFLGRIREIPHSGYHVEGVPTGMEAGGSRSVYVMHPAKGVYTLWVLGTDEGPYHLSLRASDGTGHGRLYTVEGMAEVEGVQEFLIDYDPDRVDELIRVSRPISLIFQAPIRADVENVVQVNRTIPVRVEARLNGEPLSDLAPEIWIEPGDYRESDPASVEDVTEESTHAADATGVMHWNGQRYVYNLSTGDLERDAHYTLIVRVHDAYGIVIGETRALLLTR